MQDMVTIKDVARKSGVAISTVSKYLNGGNVRQENAEAIRAAIAELDYRANPFARKLKSEYSRSIGILIPDLAAPFYGNVITAIDEIFRELGYHILISNYGGNHGLERDNLQFLISHGIDGLIYVPEDLSAEEFYELTAHQNVPVVQIDRVILGVKSDTVVVDNSNAVYQAVSTLIQQGHRRIGIISGPKSIYTAKERQVGYLRALSDHNIMYDDRLMVSGKNVFTTGYRGCELLLHLDDPPTAVITTNYDITIGLITAVRDQGLHIPEDVDVVGFDCVNVCTMMKPPLPVIYQPEKEIGRAAAKFLIERLSGFTGEPRTVRLKCILEPK